MAITIVDRPVKFTSAYKPNTWTFKSTRYPNSTPGEVNLAISFIVIADAALVATFPLLTVGQFCVIHDPIVVGTWVTGQAVVIEGNPVASFNGTFRVLATPYDNITVVNATDPGGFLGGIGGTISKLYERYRLVVDVTFDTQTDPQRYILDPSLDTFFRLDVRNQAQREFLDIFDLVSDNMNGGIFSADNYITNKYRLSIGEAFNLPDAATGINTYVVDFKDGIDVLAKDNIVVNSVQPYHHYNEWTQEVDLDWDTNLTPYIVDPANSDSLAAKMLTYLPGVLGSTGEDPIATVTVGPDDTHFLAFLSKDFEPATYGMRIIRRSATGSEQGTATTYYNINANSYILAIGPANVPINVASTQYDIVVVNSDGKEVTRRYRIVRDTECHLSPVRVFALNKFGAIDSFRFIGYDKRNTEADRDFVSKPTMAPTIGSGDYMRRGWRVQPERRHTTESETLTKPMLRYVCDEIMESADIRTVVNTGVWTPIVNLTDDLDMGFRTGRVIFEYAYGVDNMVQTR